MTDFADTVAAKVISTFRCCPGNGKPKAEGDSIIEFTVLASIVAKINSSQRANGPKGDVLRTHDTLIHTDVTVISLATGTKCAGKNREDVNGYITSDSHAEVLARRGLVRWLAKCIAAAQKNPKLFSDLSFPLIPIYKVDQTNVADKAGNTAPIASYAVKDDWTFYLYVSDCPCGDASLYPRTIQDSAVVGFTGAKLIRSNMTATSSSYQAGIQGIAHGIVDATSQSIVTESGCCSWEREGVQDLGVVRTKSGRSDIQVQNRTSSMSCSDKICR